MGGGGDVRIFPFYFHQPLRYYLYAPSFSVGPFQVGVIRLFCLPATDKVVSITRLRGDIWRDILFYFVFFLFKWRKDEDISDWQGLLLVAVGPNVPHLRFPSNTNRYVRTVHLTVSSLHQLSTTWRNFFQSNIQWIKLSPDRLYYQNQCWKLMGQCSIPWLILTRS